MALYSPPAPTVPGSAPAGALRTGTRRGPAAIVVVTLVVAIAVLGSVQLVQGTAAIGLSELWAWLLGSATDPAVARTTAVLVDSRLPRLAAGVLVGVALGSAGAVLQSLSRNPLASPDTLAVSAGATLAVALGGVVGLQGSVVGSLISTAGLAFAGGLGAALLVMVLTGGRWGTVRLVLAGSATALVLISLATSVMILYPLETQGLHAWTAGSLSQNGTTGVRTFAPVVLAGVLLLMAQGRRLDLLGLGEDQARALGVPVRRTQVVVLLLAVALTAAAVTVTGPIGFLGLVAPALVRLAAGRVPALHRHHLLIPVSGLVGVVVVLAADVVLRAAIGAQAAVEVPTGVVTSVLGAVVLVASAHRLRSSVSSRVAVPLEVRTAGRTSVPGRAGRRRTGVLLVVLVALAVAACLAAALIGDSILLTGDLTNWLLGDAGPRVSFVLENRLPRVCAAFLAGAALAVAGCAVQAVSRNALAEPALIGVSGGASVVAVLVVTLAPGTGFWLVAGGAGLGAVLAALLVFGLAARSGFAGDRLVLIGIGVASGATAVVTLLIVLTDPWNAAKALTWLSGSTYGRTFTHLLPLAAGLVLVVPLLVARSSAMDLLSVDEDTPRVLGLRLPSQRLALLGGAVVLTGLAVAAIGVIGFVGLVAPHAARTLVGRRHVRVLPVAMLLGGTLVVLADLLGRAVIAPEQLPAGLLTAIVGAPYFFWLMYRSR